MAMKTTLKTLYNSADLDGKSDAAVGLFTLAVEDDVSPPMKSFNWVLITDRSGSMDVGTKMTRLETVKHTMKKMMEYFLKDAKERDAVHHVHILMFDHTVEHWDTVVDKETDISDALAKVASISSGGATDINKALMTAADKRLKKGNTKTAVVLLSDGEVTQGTTCHDTIISSLSSISVAALEGCIGGMDSVTYAIMGYGSDHSVELLESMASQCGGSYYCVEGIEGAGVCYGEVVHEVIFEKGRSGSITVSNGEIFDPIKCVWSDTIEIGTISSGKVYNWSLRKTELSEDITVSLNYIYISDGEWHGGGDLTVTPKEPDIGQEDRECRLYELRSRTLCLLRKARDHWHTAQNCLGLRRVSMRRPPRARLYDSDSDSDNDKLLTLPAPPHREPQTETKAEDSSPTRVLMKEMDDMMQELNGAKEKLGDDDGFISGLCDDIHVAQKALTSSNGYAYIVARHVSQGLQRAYNASDLSDLMPGTVASNNNYVMSPGLTTPYLSRETSAGAVLREISQSEDTEEL
jgi:Mg-chelatase subunit ChlD